MLAFSLSELLCRADFVYDIFILPCACFSLIGCICLHSLSFSCVLITTSLRPYGVDVALAFLLGERGAFSKVLG
jgi:hypothetical protein